MTQEVKHHKPVTDGITVVSIAAIAMSLNVAFHEGAHALTCVAVGSDLQEYSALYVSCDSPTMLQQKIVAGSAPVFNLLAGMFMWILLRRGRERSPEGQLFLWLFMLMNWFYAAGYWIFSGVANIGDWAVVIDGWQPTWVLRAMMIILGIFSYMVFVNLGLQAFGRMAGGEPDDQIRRGNMLSIIAYVASVLVILLAGVFCPYGPLSLPVTAGLFAAMGALSPLLWMMRWFRLERFQKLYKEPLEIRRRWSWLVTAVIVVFVYARILGMTLYF